MSVITFAKGGGGKASTKGGGIVGAIVGAVAGDGGCGTGTVSGKKGFQKGNKCSGKENRNQQVASARSAHTAAARTAKSHITKARKAGTALSAEGRAAVRTAAAAHRELQAARATHQAGKREARNTKARETRAAARAAAPPKPPKTPKTAAAKTTKATEPRAEAKAALKADQVTPPPKKPPEKTTKDDRARQEYLDDAARRKAAFDAAYKKGNAGLQELGPILGTNGAKATKAAPTADKLSTKDFADRVVKAAHASPTGGFGNEKTLISHVKGQLEKTDPAFKGMSDEAFKARLLEANTAGHLELGRGDRTHTLDSGDVKASSTPHMNVDYHFVRHPEKAAAPSPTPKATIADRVKGSAKEASDIKTKRATEGIGSAKDPAAIDRVARGASKDELFAAAKAAGIEHGAKTKAALVEHLKGHVAGQGKSAPAKAAPTPKPAEKPAATPPKSPGKAMEKKAEPGTSAHVTQRINELRDKVASGKIKPENVEKHASDIVRSAMKNKLAEGLESAGIGGLSEHSSYQKLTRAIVKHAKSAGNKNAGNP